MTRQHGVGVLCSRVLALAAVVTLSLAAQILPAQESPSETQLKAAFLVNFPKYVEWPAGSFAKTNSPFVVAVLDETKLDEELQKMAESKVVNGRAVVFKRVTTDADIAGCHVLFISAEQQRRSAGILARLQDASVLTVGESDDFLANGGMINLARRDRKIALEVNLTAARKARLKISSKLLSVASVVKGGKE